MTRHFTCVSILLHFYQLYTVLLREWQLEAGETDQRGNWWLVRRTSGGLVEWGDGPAGELVDWGDGPAGELVEWGGVGPPGCYGRRRARQGAAFPYQQVQHLLYGLVQR